MEPGRSPREPPLGPWCDVLVPPLFDPGPELRLDPDRLSILEPCSEGATGATHGGSSGLAGASEAEKLRWDESSCSGSVSLSMDPDRGCSWARVLTTLEDTLAMASESPLIQPEPVFVLGWSVPMMEDRFRTMDDRLDAKDERVGDPGLTLSLIDEVELREAIECDLGTNPDSMWSELEEVCFRLRRALSSRYSLSVSCS